MGGVPRAARRDAGGRPLTGPAPAARPSILLTGGSGQVGWELRRTLSTLGDVVAPPSAALDVGDAGALRAAVRALAPAIIVNAAAYTAVDRAESDGARAHAVNADAPGVLGEEARRLGVPVVHFSTDYVFDGTARAPYDERAAPAPLNVYGESKLAGERALLDSGAAALVLRTSWVYGLRGANFLRTMLRLARERDELRVVDDQVGAPTWSRAIAEGTAQLVARLAAAGGGRFALGELPAGVYHFAAAGATTWYGFACALLALDPARDDQRCRSVRAIATDDYPTPARRPRYSCLDSSRLALATGIRLPDWRHQLALAMEEAGHRAG